MRVKSEAKRQAIVDIAAEIFTEEGFEAASMSAIAERVGGSKATLYSYFPSKEELFLEVLLASAQKHVLDAFESLKISTDIAKGLNEFGVRYLNFITSDHPSAMYRLAIAAGGRSDLGKQFYSRGPARFIEIMSGIFQSFIDRQELRAADTKIMAMHYKSLLQAELIERRLMGELPSIKKTDLNEPVARAVNVFMSAYGLKPA